MELKAKGVSQCDVVTDTKDKEQVESETNIITKINQEEQLQDAQREFQKFVSGNKSFPLSRTNEKRI